MYLQHELQEVTEYRQTEALKRIGWLHSLMQQQPGFRRTLACRYLGGFTQYAWLRFWDSSEQQIAFRQTPEAREFARTRVEGLYGPLPGGIAAGVNWESVLEIERPEGGDILVRAAYEVAPGREREFIELRRRHADILLAVPGITSVLAFRCADAGAENVYLTLIRARDRDAYNTVLESPAAASYRKSLPAGVYKSLVRECYEIVEELTAG